MKKKMNYDQDQLCKDSELIQKIYNGAGMGELKTVSDRDSMIGSLGD